MEAGIEAAGETIQTNLFLNRWEKHTFFFQIFKASLRDDDVSPASDKLWWMDLFFSVDLQENLLLEYDKICKMYYCYLFVCQRMKSSYFVPSW